VIISTAGTRIEPGPLLEHDADPRAEVRTVAPRVETEHPDSAAVGPAEALAALDGRGLAGSVRAEQRRDGAFGHGEREVVDRGDVAVAFHQGVDLDGGSRAHRGSVARALV
jgi:hypothetical protein